MLAFRKNLIKFNHKFVNQNLVNTNNVIFNLVSPKKPVKNSSFIPNNAVDEEWVGKF
jgi:hypothetical protein